MNMVVLYIVIERIKHVSKWLMNETCMYRTAPTACFPTGFIVEFYWPAKYANLITLFLNNKSNLGSVRPVYEN